MSIIRVSHATGLLTGRVRLNGSKSISNRVLMIKALSGLDFPIRNLSTCDDTKTMGRLLAQEDTVYDAHHAGTTFRFLTAYLSLQPDMQELTGSSRMKERPIGPLVDALRSIGASITYLEKEGYPPLAIDSPQDMTAVREVHINAGISSQYITALILIAPTLPNGLTIHLEGEMVSESYLMMTIKTVEEFGIQVQYDGKTISIPPQLYKSTAYTVEADWSAASYYYSLIALAKSGSRIELQGLFENSTQGDAEISSFGEQFGVSTTWEGDTCILTKVKGQSSLTYDFINQPDIAQTLAVICSAKAIRSDFTGLRTLRIKETDRIYAVDQELGKVGGSFRHTMTAPNGEEHYSTDPISWDGAIPRFETYKDHRMAMAFAPLALLSPIEINKPEVVSKSYPEFWDHLEELGFLIDRIHG